MSVNDPSVAASTLDEAALREVLDASPDAIAIFESGRIVLENAAFRALRAEVGPFSNEELERLLVPSERGEERHAGRVQRVLLGNASKRLAVEARCAKLCADVVPRDVKAVFLRECVAEERDPNPQNQQMSAVSQQADRLTALGQLVAGVAHDINNPLACVVVNLEILERELLAREAASTTAGERSMLAPLLNAREGAERVRNIVRDLMAFARPIADSKQLINVESVLDSMVSLAWNEIRHRARLVKRYARVPAVEGDESRLAQVFLNLIVSAAQAIDEGEANEGAITLSTTTEGDRVVIEVADSGRAGAHNELSRDFEPLFSSRSSQRGSGIGLAICRTIVASHGGHIDVTNDTGRGAKFRVSLPIARQASTPRKSTPPSTRAATKRQRILIIDDEPLLGQTLTFAFAERHDIVLAASGRDAIQRLAEDDRYDLVLCDLMMPDVSGPKVFEAVERDHPALLPRFAFMTGGAFTERAQEFLESYAGRRLDKPFTIADIERLLVELRGEA